MDRSGHSISGKCVKIKRLRGLEETALDAELVTPTGITLGKILGDIQWVGMTHPEKYLGMYPAWTVDSHGRG